MCRLDLGVHHQLGYLLAVLDAGCEDQVSSNEFVGVGEVFVGAEQSRGGGDEGEVYVLPGEEQALRDYGYCTGEVGACYRGEFRLKVEN